MDEKILYKLAAMKDSNNELKELLEYIADTLNRIEELISQLNKNNNELLTSNDLQKMGFSRTKAFQILPDPSLNVIKIGRRKYVNANDLKDYLESKQ